MDIGKKKAIATLHCTKPTDRKETKNFHHTKITHYALM